MLINRNAILYYSSPSLQILHEKKSIKFRNQFIQIVIWNFRSDIVRVRSWLDFYPRNEQILNSLDRLDRCKIDGRPVSYIEILVSTISWEGTLGEIIVGKRIGRDISWQLITTYVNLRYFRKSLVSQLLPFTNTLAEPSRAIAW